MDVLYLFPSRGPPRASRPLLTLVFPLSFNYCVHAWRLLMTWLSLPCAVPVSTLLMNEAKAY